MTHRIVTNKFNTRAALVVTHTSGKQYTALEFNTNPFATDPTALVAYSAHKARRPDNVAGVEVAECWRSGGGAVITWDDGDIEQVIFGKRKPGTVGKLSGPKSFPGSRQRDGRRRGY